MDKQRCCKSSKIIFAYSIMSSLHDDLSNFRIGQGGATLLGIDGRAACGGKLYAHRLLEEGIVYRQEEKLVKIKNQ